MAELQTVGSLFDHLRRHLGPQAPRDAREAGALWERYLDVVAQSTGVARGRLRRGARFVEDLGVD